MTCENNGVRARTRPVSVCGTLHRIHWAGVRETLPDGGSRLPSCRFGVSERGAIQVSRRFWGRDVSRMLVAGELCAGLWVESAGCGVGRVMYLEAGTFAE